MDELNQSLPKLDLHVLLCTLYEFIETNLRHRDPGEHEWGWVCLTMHYPSLNHTVTLLTHTHTYTHTLTHTYTYTHSHTYMHVCARACLVLYLYFCRLTDVLKAHLDYYSLPQLADLDYLPDNITIGQTVSMWKHIVIYQHKKTNTAAMQLY